MRIALALLLALAALPITAQQISTQQGEKIKKIEEKLMAPCCYTQNIREHMSQEAEQMREEVTSMVLAGKSEHDILEYYKTEYGDPILVVPDGNSGRVLFMTPYLILIVVGGVLTVLLLKAAKRNNPVSTHTTAETHNDDWLAMRQRIRAELGEQL